MKESTSRREFLKQSAFAGLAASLGGASLARADTSGGRGDITLPSGVTIGGDIGATRPRPAGQIPVHDLTTGPMERIRVAHIGLRRGMAHVKNCLKLDNVDTVAVCDINDARARKAAAECVARGVAEPAVYSGEEDAWERMIDRDDIDVVYISTPWEWHVPMAVRAMERGKHAFVEVSAAVTVDDCWKLVDTSERTRRHCVMLENCCYGESELFLLGIVRAGLLGEVTHAECAYIHDLRKRLFDMNGPGIWRRNYHRLYDGNLYPTHGLGPVAQYLGVGRGDQFKFLVSMSSPERALSRQLATENPNDGRHAGEKYLCGDMNTTLIKTELGRSIMVQHDVVSPRPYSRINLVSGTGGTFADYPPRLALDDPKSAGLEGAGAHDWLGETEMKKLRERFTHPFWTRLRERAIGGGHGGMDFIMNWRHLDCLRQGITPDSVVYDAAAWSSIVELSSRSVATGSMPVAIPDFTRGLWRTMTPLGVVG